MNDEGTRNLINAIIRKAVLDYQYALKHEDFETIQECECFFQATGINS